MEVPFGILNGRVVDVSRVSRGKACNCTCLSCGKPLVAKKGSLVAHHFAHESEAGCQTSVETIFHAAAKNILLTYGRVRLPAVEYIVGNFRGVAAPSLTARLQSAVAEKRKGDTVPDISGLVEGRPLHIEIAVTHAVDVIKEAKIAAYGVDTVEIFVELNRWSSIDTLREFIEVGKHARRWVYHHKVKEMQEALLNHAQRRRICYSYVRGWPEVYCPNGKCVGLEHNCHECKYLVADIPATEEEFKRYGYSPLAILCTGTEENSNSSERETPTEERWRRPTLPYRKTALQEAEDAFTWGFGIERSRT